MIAESSCIREFSGLISEEILRRKGEAVSFPDTLYIGGGTPSVLPLSVIERIVADLGGGPWREFTMEVNPDDIVSRGEGFVRELRGLGVNRISMGVQSFDDGILRWMNRRHDAGEAAEAFRLLREGGFDNIGIDLIFGMPGLGDSLWEKTLDTALSLPGGPPEHISAYQLSVDENSSLGEMAADGRFTPAPDEDCRRQYDRLSERLAEAGYHHYEISNFALPGREAVHNSAYWDRTPYSGFGPGAHSFDGKRRFWNTSDIPWKPVYEDLTEKDAVIETIMLSLRTDKGADKEFLHGNCSPSAVSAMMEKGLLETAGDRVRIPEKHWFISDSIIAELI